ncbi:unnamed protein product [Ascophyllum nodosum]
MAAAPAPSSVPSWIQQGHRPMAANGAGYGADGAGNGAARVGGEGYDLYGFKPQMADTNMVRFGFRIASLALGVMMIVASFVEIFNLTSFNRFFIAIYNMLFAGVLILHESQGLVMCDGVDSSMRRYFGLLYGHMGRALFIIFIAFLNFALDDAGWLGTTTAVLLLVLGGSMMLIYLKYPDLLDEAPGLGDLKTAPPRREGYAPPPEMPSTSL